MSDRLGEFALIERLLSHFPPTTVAIGPGDDAAMIQPAAPIVVTTDSLVEGRHFRSASFAPEDIGWKALAVNLSDIAAMGAEPRWFLWSLTLPAEWELAWLEGVAGGLAACAKRYAVELVGGNIAGGTQELTLSVTAIGELTSGAAWRRDGARAGDAIGVLGRLGWAAAGHIVLERDRQGGHGPLRDRGEAPFLDELRRAQRRPIPRCDAPALFGGASLRPNAAIDVSDGFLQDLGHILRASDVGADLELSALRSDDALSQFARASAIDPWELIVAGGEDYALIITTDQPREVEGVRWVGRCVPEADRFSISLDGAAYRLPEVRGFRHV
ncbi:MAG: thiamine-phosphate kinase [Myxococcales bacterium]|nr:thiamine-phosphate kinase [Myxococcales bacterium]